MRQAEVKFSAVKGDTWDGAEVEMVLIDFSAVGLIDTIYSSGGANMYSK